MSKLSHLNAELATSKYGIKRGKLKYYMSNLFYFPATAKATLDRYFIANWSTQHFLTRLFEGRILHEGIYYEVIYYDTDPTKMIRRAKHTEVKLSFRAADYLYNITPKVLVKEIVNPIKNTDSKDSDNDSNK